jgi:hypothetical protein
MYYKLIILIIKIKNYINKNSKRFKLKIRLLGNLGNKFKIII